MDAFFVWQPVRTSSNSVEIVITPFESFKVGKGGPQFVRAVAELLGLPVPTKWTIQPFRSAFFTEIDDNWEDRWAISWSVTVDVPEGVELPDLGEGPRALDKWDESWDSARDDVNKAPEMECRVVAEFLTDADAKAAASAIRAAGFEPRFRRVPKFIRLDTSLGTWKSSDYPARLDEAESIVGICRQHNGATKHMESYKRYMATKRG
jgi:hypothetical protein